MPLYFIIESSYRLPGLGLLVRPAAPAPAWLFTAALHTALELRLHGAGLAVAPPLVATIEEITRPDARPARALLLAADPEALPKPNTGTWLELLAIMPEYLR